MPITIFCCYARKDKALLDELKAHLRPLQRQGLIDVWDDGDISAGTEWEQEIVKHLDTAQIILLLVSPDFMDSDYCYENEMRRALERHKHRDVRVIPIILRPCDWQHSPLQDLQCLPSDGKPVTEWDNLDVVFLDIAKGLRRVIEQQQALPHLPVLLSPLARQNRMRMLKQIRKIWVDGLLTQSLHNAARIELHLQDRPDMLANPLRLQVQELNQIPQPLSDGTTIVEVYDKAEGELLILGEPGAGKTTLLLELTATLLERANKDEQFRIPIVFNLSSWAEKRQALRTWLVEELWAIYRVPRKIGEGWIDADQVLPLLDGLDEVAKEARIACVQKINDYYQSRLDCGSSLIVVCCRSQEYATLSTRIMLQHAVSILPLTDSQINIYLEQVGEQAEALKQALDEDVELRRLARQPLMLNIFTLAYQGASREDVPTGKTRKETPRIVFAQYVERMLKRRGQSKRWKPERVIHWLTFLAKQMQQRNQTVFLLERMQPDWLSLRSGRRIYVLLSTFVVILAYLLVTLSTNEVYSLELQIHSIAEIMPFNGLTALLSVQGLFLLYTKINARIQARDWRIEPVETLFWEQSRVLLWLREGTLIGLLIGLLIGVLYGPFIGLIVGLSMLLVVCLCGGLLFGLGDGSFTKFLDESKHMFPNEGIWRSARNGLFVALIEMLGVGLLVSVILWIVGGPPIIGIIFVLASGLLGMLYGGGLACIQHMVLRMILWLCGSTPQPWNYVRFFDYATERILLRRVGGGYMFTHRLLLEYFVQSAILNESVNHSSSAASTSNQMANGRRGLRKSHVKRASRQAKRTRSRRNHTGR